MKTLRTALIALLILLCGSSTFAQDSYKKKLQEYLELSGTMKSFQVAVSQMINTFRQSNNSAPAEFWDDFEKEIGSTSIDELLVLIEPIYKKHLSEADIDGIIAFYKSPAGKNLAEKTPAIMQESMAAGQTWGQEIGMKVLNKLKEKGYK